MRTKFQSYYAAQFGSDLTPIKARILDNKLETKEIHFNSKDYSEITYLQGEQKVKKLINSTMLTSSPWWSARFEIHEGLIISPNYHEGSFSSKFAQQWQQNDTHKILTSEYGRFYPDLLYAIPQNIWNEFLTQLPLQNIVEELDLSVHRHLWPAYNYSASTYNLTVLNWRAKAFRQYHFLVSYLDPVKEEYCFYGKSQKWKEVIDQGLIAEGKMLDVAKNYFGSYVTADYLDKFSHYPLVNAFTLVGDLIESRATSVYGIGAINTDRLDEFVATLPSSKSEPVNFEKMISDVNSIHETPSIRFAQRLKGRIFFHARSNFGLFKTKNLDNYSHCRSYFLEIFNNLIYPEILRVFFEISNLEYDTYNKHSNELVSLYSSAQETFKVILHEYLAVDELIKLTSEWHMTRAVTNSKKPEAMIKLQWHPLFSKQIINQVTFSCLESQAELRKEGEEMHNCAGGWAPQCMQGYIHVIKVLTCSGERSTLWLHETKRNNFNIIYNLKSGQERDSHITACDEIREASEIFLEKINKDASILNFQRGRTENSAEQIDNIAEFYPYPLYNQVIQETIYQAYPKDHLPSFMRAANYRLMIEELSKRFDLTECIGDALPQYDQRMLVEFNKC